MHSYEILEQDTTDNDISNAGHFNPEVFVNCIQGTQVGQVYEYTQLTKTSGSKRPAFD